MKKSISILVVLVGLFLFATRSANAAASLSCYAGAFWANPGPPPYTLKTVITTAHPGATVAISNSFKNNGTTTLTGVVDTFNPYGVPWTFKDADPVCTFSSPYIKCNVGTMVPGGNTSRAARIHISASAVIGSVMYMYSAITASGGLRSDCPTPTLTIN